MAAPAAALFFLRKGPESREELRDDALLLAEPAHVQVVHVRREEAPPDEALSSAVFNSSKKTLRFSSTEASRSATSMRI